MKFIVLCLLLVSCSLSENDKIELRKKAQDYCSCSGGIWTLQYNYLNHDAHVTCSNGYRQLFDLDDYIQRNCN